MTKRSSANKLKLLCEIYIIFLKLGAIGFGGGFALISLMEKKFVEEKKWMDRERMIDIFGIAQCLPGAIVLNTSGFMGYSIAGVPGAVVAMTANATVPVIMVLVLTILFSEFSTYQLVQQAFSGIRPAIVALITCAAYKMAKNFLVDWVCVVISISAFICLFFFNIQPILIIFMGAIIGICLTFSRKYLNNKKQSSMVTKYD